MNLSLHKTFKKVRILLCVDLGWFFRFTLKRSVIYLDYLFSLSWGRNFWPVVVDDIEIRLSFNNSYQHNIAKLLARRKHEFHLLELWKSVCEERQIVADIGGYNGIFGLISAIANPKSTVYIFEPDIKCFKQIEDNISLNKLKNVIVVPLAVWDKTQQLFFTINAETGGSIVSLGSSIQACKFDDYFKDKVPPSLIKIDIEGSELRALRGMQGILSRLQTRVLVEIHPILLRKFGDSPEDFQKFVEQMGYRKLCLEIIKGISEHYWLYH